MRIAAEKSLVHHICSSQNIILHCCLIAAVSLGICVVPLATHVTLSCYLQAGEAWSFLSPCTQKADIHLQRDFQCTFALLSSHILPKDTLFKTELFTCKIKQGVELESLKIIWNQQSYTFSFLSLFWILLCVSRRKVYGDVQRSDRQQLTQAYKHEPMKCSPASDPTNHIKSPMLIISFLRHCTWQQCGVCGFDQSEYIRASWSRCKPAEQRFQIQ